MESLGMMLTKSQGEILVNVEQADKLYFKPRGSYYNVVFHKVKIKVGEDWIEGCVYQDIDSKAVYSRPYIQFNVDKWEFI